jgi:hypothetical protein
MFSTNFEKISKASIIHAGLPTLGVSVLWIQDSTIPPWGRARLPVRMASCLPKRTENPENFNRAPL